MQGAFSCCLDRMVGMSAVWVGTSQDWKNFMQENFGLIFSFPKEGEKTCSLIFFLLFLGMENPTKRKGRPLEFLGKKGKTQAKTFQNKLSNNVSGSFWADGVFTAKFPLAQNPAANQTQKWDCCSLLWYH